MNFALSTRYQAWASRLRLPWMDRVGRAVVMAYAKVVGDLTIDGATQANLEHLPEFATATSIALTASERQLDAGTSELVTALATRTTKAVPIWKYAGTPLGMLLALHFAGFGGGVIVTQNGLAYQLALPLPPIYSGADWNPTGNLITTALATLAVAMHSDKNIARSIPTGNSWWVFDNDTDMCSRWALLYPDALPSAFRTSGAAVFTGIEDGSTSNPWPLVTWNNSFDDTSYIIQPSGAVITDGGGPVSVFADTTTKTKTGVRIAASSPFVGTVDVLAWQAGSNPYADLHQADLQRLRNIIRRWRPRRARCTGVHALVQGHFIGWPVRTIGSATPGPGSIVSYTGGF